MPGKPITDQQVRLYMTDRPYHNQRVAAARAGFSERTARRIEASPLLPSQCKAIHGRTVPDPLEAVWSTVLVPILERESAVQAVTLLRHLQMLDPDGLPDDQVRRTLERRVRDWRALHGPERDVIFSQSPEPGRMGLSDFTDASKLGVTILGDFLAHRLFHFVLAYSGWEHAAPVLGGESFTALAENLQTALWMLGGAPLESRTDSLSAAYRNLDKDAADDVTKRHEDFCRHYGMIPSRNNPGEAHENGAVEAHNNHLKVALDQALILRGSRDFPDIAAWRRFVDEVVARRNRRREDRVKVELPKLKPLPERRTTDFTELVVRVVRTGGFLVHSVFYSVPSRLIGQRLRVHVYDDRIEAWRDACRHPYPPARAHWRQPALLRQLPACHSRLAPQALASSVYRDELFPRSEYAWTFLSEKVSHKQACRRMVDLLWLAHSENCEAELALLIARDLTAGRLSRARSLRQQLAPRCATLPDDPPVRLTDLSSFDALLEGRA